MAYERETILKPFREQEDYMRDRVRSGIEQNRKGRATVKVTDREGKPVPGARITAVQKSHEFRVGANLFALTEMETEEKAAEYRRLFAECFNLATLPFYWAFLEPERGRPRYAEDSPKIYRRPPIDPCLAFCEANGIEPKAHCLDYDIFAADWVKEMNTVPEIRKALYKRFSELAERYAARIPSWEVTNENLFLPNPGRNTVNFTQSDNVEWDFRMADRLFPLNRLVINEAAPNIWPCFNGNRSAYYMQIERALYKGCRIDSIGMQYHMVFPEEKEAEETKLYYSPEHLYRVMDCYAALGLPLQITELTVPCYRVSEADEEIQAEIIKNVYSMWFSHPAMEAIIYWDVPDGYDWTELKGSLVRHDLTPKKAYRVIRDLFHRTWRTEEETVTDEAGRASFKGFFGDYEITVHAGEKSVKQDVKLLKKGKREFAVTV